MKINPCCASFEVDDPCHCMCVALIKSLQKKILRIENHLASEKQTVKELLESRESR